MKLASFEAIVEVLNCAEVRYLVVGGLAVNAHGYLRVTNDVDLVVRLELTDVRATFSALAGIGYFPAVPVTADQFADPEMRESWCRDEGMLVLKFWSDFHRETPVDVFVYEPSDFELEYSRAMIGVGPDDPPARFVGIPALIEMKRVAGRDRDRTDIEMLRRIDEQSCRDA
ncbi:MAG: hypothetical protein WA771_10425 [Chthoniobacterales bacterium]